MVEELEEIFIETFQKHNMKCVCVLGSYLFNQYNLDSNFIGGFLIGNNK